MAVQTFSELFNDALRQVDETGAVAKTIIKSGINEGYSEVAGLRDWKTLENTGPITTVSGTFEYTPITSSASVPRIRRIISVVDETNARYLTEQKREDFERDYPYVDTSATENLGTPTYWFQSGYDTNRDIKVKLYQVPNSALTVRLYWYEEPLPLVNDADEPRIPDQYHYGLVYPGIAKYYEYFHHFDRALYYRQLFEEYKRTILGAEYGTSDEMPEIKPQTTKRGYVIGKIGRVYN